MLIPAWAQVVSVYSAPTPATPQNGLANVSVLSALAGALTANQVANKTNNSAAMSATQGNLVNLEAGIVSSSVTGAFSALAKTHS